MTTRVCLTLLFIFSSLTMTTNMYLLNILLKIPLFPILVLISQLITVLVNLWRIHLNLFHLNLSILMLIHTVSILLSELAPELENHHLGSLIMLSVCRNHLSFLWQVLNLIWISYRNLLSPSHIFVFFLSKIKPIHHPTTYSQAYQHSEWQQAMEVELQALEANKTWTVVDLPRGKRAIGCKWVCKIQASSWWLSVQI